jgi:hypothetical protein
MRIFVNNNGSGCQARCPFPVSSCSFGADLAYTCALNMPNLISSKSGAICTRVWYAIMTTEEMRVWGWKSTCNHVTEENPTLPRQKGFRVRRHSTHHLPAQHVGDMAAGNDRHLVVGNLLGEGIESARVFGTWLNNSTFKATEDCEICTDTSGLHAQAQDVIRFIKTQTTVRTLTQIL